jgi:hypothetical protein
MANDTLEAIQNSYRVMDIFGPAATASANDEIAERTGEARGDVTEEDLEGVNGNEPLAPLSTAIGMATFAQTPEFQTIRRAWQELLEGFIAKSENLKLSADERIANQSMALGIKKALVVAAEVIAAAQERLRNTSVEERMAIGDSAKAVLAKLVEAPAPNDVRGDLIEADARPFKSSTMREQVVTAEENARRIRAAFGDK